MMQELLVKKTLFFFACRKSMQDVEQLLFL
ncbi:Uncharacterised protein [Vibrio cholerae]|nr:Uncharacterised protein [Vibrio cholerae]